MYTSKYGKLAVRIIAYPLDADPQFITRNSQLPIIFRASTLAIKKWAAYHASPFI